MIKQRKYKEKTNKEHMKEKNNEQQTKTKNAIMIKDNKRKSIYKILILLDVFHKYMAQQKIL